jgi:hypothetical protein
MSVNQAESVAAGVLGEAVLPELACCDVVTEEPAVC